jgi:hypothetical protein
MKNVILIVIIVKLFKTVKHYFPHKHTPTPNICALDLIFRKATRPRAKLRRAIIRRSSELFVRTAIGCTFVQMKN